MGEAMETPLLAVQEGDCASAPSACAASASAFPAAEPGSVEVVQPPNLALVWMRGARVAGWALALCATFALLSLLQTSPRCSTSQVEALREVWLGNVSFVSSLDSVCFGSISKVGEVVEQRNYGASIWSFSIDGFPPIDSLSASLRSRKLERLGCCSLRFVWQGVRLKGGGGATLDIFVRADLNKESGLTEMLVGFDNATRAVRPLSWSVSMTSTSTEARFQVLQNRGFGVLHECADKSDQCGKFTSGQYPCDSASFQLISLMNSKGAAYFATHDLDYSQKQFFSSGQDFRVTQGVPLLPGALRILSFQAGYPVSVGLAENGWFSVAQRYRDAFAIRALDKNGRKRMDARIDLPAWFQDVGVWISSHWQQRDIFNRAGGDPSVVAKLMETVLRKLKVKGRIGLHWYEWDTLGYVPGSNYTKCSNDRNVCGFDTNYPEYFPARRGFGDVARHLQDQGVLVMPYLNGRIMDRDIVSWNKTSHAAAAKKNDDLEMYEESYGSRARFSVMCPATPFWQTAISDTVERLSSQNNIEYVYVDQLAAAPPVPCMDPSHNHTLNGGSYWVAGQTGFVKRAKASVARGGKSMVFMTEGLAESYAGLVDSFLTLTPMDAPTSGDDGVLVPFFQAVYGGYTTWAGAFFFKKDLTDNPNVFAAKLAKQLVYGVQLGWFALLQLHFDGFQDMGFYDQLFADDEQYGQELEYLHLLAAARYYLRAFFVHGRASCTPLLSTATERKERLKDVEQAEAWRGLDRAQLRNLTESPIQSATWLNSDESQLLVVYTWAERPEDQPHQQYVNVSWTIPGAHKCGLIGTSDRFNIEELDMESGNFVHVTTKSGKLQHTSKLGARNLQAFRITYAD